MKPTLTRDQILAMPAGNDLDCAVGVHVMGFTIEPREMEYDGEKIQFKYCAQAFAGEIPKYSTDIAHAWAVVEKIHMQPPNIGRSSDSGPWFAVESPWCNSERWCAGWCDYIQYEGQGMIHDFHAVAETAPLAICRAALLTFLKDAEVQA